MSASTVTWKRSIVQLLAMAGAVALLAIVGFRWLVVEEAPSAPTVKVEAPAPRSFAVVTRVVGSVESSLGGAGWQPMASGDRLEENAVLRTGASSSAEVEAGEATRLWAEANTELAVGPLARDRQVFRLHYGRVAAAVDPSNGRTVRIENDAGVAVETTSARFAVMSTGRILAVVTEAGGVTLTSAGGQVRVQPGEVALVEDGGAPTAATPLPRELLLKVVRARRAGLCAVIDGLTVPGAEVRVDGQRIEVGSSGRFRVEVPREEGRTQVRLATHDVSGRTVEEPIPCETQPRPTQPAHAAGAEQPPVSRLKVDWRAAP